MALKKLKNNKATGFDDLRAELLKESGPLMKERLFKLVKRIYERGELPSDFVKTVIVPIPKKPGAKKCEQYRTISLISHASKIVSNIILHRMERKIEDFLTEDQFGFRKRVGTREAILGLRLILEKRLEKGRKTHLAFIDIEKAFDNVKWPVMFEILRKCGIEYRDRKIIWNLYKNETAVIKIGNEQQEAVIRKGVRQGCALSPIIFNAYIQDALNKVRENMDLGIKIQGKRINMIRFADDIVVMAESEGDLETILKMMENTMGKEYDMKINKTKTKIMVCDKDDRQRNANVTIIMNEETLEEVDEFTYLGSIITKDGRSKREIRSRIRQAKIAFNKKKRLFISNNIKLCTRKRLLKAYVWSVALYGCETWTVGKEERRRLDSFENWCYRRMLKISWKDKITNEEVYQKIGEKNDIWRSIKNRRTGLVGHILRHESMIKTILEGMIEGKRCRGRPRLDYMKQLLEDLNCTSYQELKRKAEKRADWRTAADQSKKD